LSAFNSEDLTHFLVTVDEVLGEPSAWANPTGYPTGMALCLIDCIYSLGIRYQAYVVPVLDRYRAHRRSEGAEPATDTASDLVQVFTGLGGPEQFAEVIGTQHKTSTHRGAPLKAAAVLQAARMFADQRIETPGDLLAADSMGDPHRGWRRVPGQTSSDTGWRYLLLLAGADEVKPDRMILRFVGRALDRKVSSSDAATIVSGAAHERGWPVRVLDHAIWRWETGPNGKAWRKAQR